MQFVRKVYDPDSQPCAKCKGPMRVIALVQEPEVIGHGLMQLMLWQPEPLRAVERTPPQRTERSSHAPRPFTYHRVPDIA